MKVHISLNNWSNSTLSTLSTFPKYYSFLLCTHHNENLSLIHFLLLPIWPYKYWSTALNVTPTKLILFFASHNIFAYWTNKNNQRNVLLFITITWRSCKNKHSRRTPSYIYIHTYIQSTKYRPFAFWVEWLALPHWIAVGDIGCRRFPDEVKPSIVFPELCGNGFLSLSNNWGHVCV